MLRLGVVGYGLRSGNLVRDAFGYVNEDFRVVGVVDPDEKTVRGRLRQADRDGVVFYDSLKEMVCRARLDGLLIGTRCHQHTPFAIEASEYGIPVFLEKPVAISMEQARSLEAAYESSKTPVIVSFPLRVSPLCEMVKDAIDRGAVGNQEHIHAINYVTYGHDYFEQGYRDYSITQGLFLQKATHDFDYMCYLMGDSVVQVAAMQTAGCVFGGDKPSGLRCSQCDEAETCMQSPANRRRSGTKNVEDDHLCVFSIDCGTVESGMNEDASSALLKFSDGRHGVYTQVFYSRRDAAARGATVSGYEGTLSFDWYQNGMKWVRHFENETQCIKVSDGQSHFGGDWELAKDFFRMMADGQPPRATIWHGIQSVYLCLAAKESAQTKQFVEVRQVGAVR